MIEDLKKNFGPLFHSLTNRQNIVSVKAGVLVYDADHKDYTSLSKEELLAVVGHMNEELREIEKAVLEAGQFAIKIDDLVWPMIKPEKPDKASQFLFH